MSIEWQLPGCGDGCAPKRHDPRVHELYGLRLGLLTLRVPPVRIVRTGPLVVDLAAGNALVRVTRVHLSPREWGLLAYLAERPGRWCLSTEIIASVWGPEYVTGRRRQNSLGQWTRADTHLVNVVTCRLRARLGEAGRLISVQLGPDGPARRLIVEEPTT